MRKPKPRPTKPWWKEVHEYLNGVHESKLMVMPANNSSSIVHYWAGKFPGRIGWLVGPTAIDSTSLRPWMPFALDNDAFSAWSKGRLWSEFNWRRMLDKVKESGLSPRWALVPDRVANRDETLRLFDKWSPVLIQYGWPLAFACQDGMTPSDVPDKCLLFIGGSTEWKWQSLPMWAETKKRIHVGRVNEVHRLLQCESLGVESVDGTGWMRGTYEGRQADDLAKYLHSKI